MAMFRLILIGASAFVASIAPLEVMAGALSLDFEQFSGDVVFPAGTTTFPPQSPGELGFAIHPALNVTTSGVRSDGLAGGSQEKELNLAGHALELLIDNAARISFRFSQPQGKEGLVINNELTAPGRFGSRFSLGLSQVVAGPWDVPVSKNDVLYTVRSLALGESYEITLQLDPAYLASHPGATIENFFVVNEGSLLAYFDDFHVSFVPEPCGCGFLACAAATLMAWRRGLRRAG